MQRATKATKRTKINSIHRQAVPRFNHTVCKKYLLTFGKKIPSNNSFPVIRSTMQKKSPFLRTPAFIFCLLWGRPCGNHAKRCINEKTIQCLLNPRRMYLSISNSFRVTRCLSQCVSPKLLFLSHFCFPWGRPWGNHAKCCMDVKRIRCLQIVPLHVPISITVSEIQRYIGRKSSFFIPACIRRPC